MKIANEKKISGQKIPEKMLPHQKNPSSIFLRCALSSVVEHYLHTVGVAGSKPAARTILFLLTLLGQFSRIARPNFRRTNNRNRPAIKPPGNSSVLETAGSD